MHQQPGVSIMFFTFGRLAGNKLEPHEREFAHLQHLPAQRIFTRASVFFLVTSRRISRITSVERNLKK